MKKESFQELGNENNIESLEARKNELVREIYGMSDDDKRKEILERELEAVNLKIQGLSEKTSNSLEV